MQRCSGGLQRCSLLLATLTWLCDPVQVDTSQLHLPPCVDQPEAGPECRSVACLEVKSRQGRSDPATHSVWAAPRPGQLLERGKSSVLCWGSVAAQHRSEALRRISHVTVLRLWHKLLASDSLPVGCELSGGHMMPLIV